MQRLATITDDTFARRVLWALRDAGLNATVTTEHPPLGLYGGQLQSIVWIADSDDLEVASHIYNDVLASQSEPHCPHCGYDLRGHAGRIECPECGRPISAPLAELTCEQCGESVPGNFDVCWNCGATVAGDSTG